MPKMPIIEQASGQAGCGGTLVSVEGKTLPLRAAEIAGEAEGGLARVVLRQTFANLHAEPLTVTYAFPLPADGAVAGYEFRIGERRVTGQVDRRAAAREHYERALIEGRTAALLDQDRSNLFTQSIGNVPPGQEVVVELRIDQRLRWLVQGMWEWRFPTVIPPRYLGGEGRVGDADRVSVEVANQATGVRATLDFEIGDRVPEGRQLESGTHAICAAARTTTGAAAAGGGGESRGLRVTFADPAGAPLDRDVVVRWPVDRVSSGVMLRRSRPAQGPHSASAYGLVTIVPPEAGGAALPRDLILLIDTSGSMRGGPLDLAKRAAAALVGSLGPSDRLEMIEFGSAPRRWRRGAATATPEIRREAHAWIGTLQAAGGTEMTRAVEEALAPLREEAARQVVLLTDGQVGFETEVLRAIRDRLPAGSRLHAVGVGTGVNRALLAPAARAGRGVEVLLDLDEATEAGVERILAATRGPVLTDVEIGGSALTGMAPRRVPDLLAGAPVLAGVRLLAEGGEFTIRAKSAAGAWSRAIHVPPTASGEGSVAITALYGREAVEDLELDRAAGVDPDETDRTIETIGLQFGLATRLTSWVAISDEPTVDPRRPIRVERMPQEIPYGLSAEGLGLRSADRELPQMMRLSDHQVERRAKQSRSAATSVFDARLVRRLFGTLRGRGDADQAPDASGIEDGTGRIALGRWVAGPSDDIQVLEVLAHDLPIDWTPPVRIRLTLIDGRTMTCDVDSMHTTAAARLEPGMAFRIALRLAADVRETVTMADVNLGSGMLRLFPNR